MEPHGPVKEDMAATVDIEIKPLKELHRLKKSTRPFVIETNTYGNISYEDFFNNHMRKNVPCLIKNVGADWESSLKWAPDDKIDFDYLTNKYGMLTVTASDSKNVFGDMQPRTEMKFNEYINYWKGNTRDKMLYLKNWRLQKCKPNDKFYVVPEIFGSDWLNEYAQDKKVDGFKYVYMGPSGSWSPVNSAIYNSFTWSVNIAGRKKWTLFPPGEEVKLKNKSKIISPRFEPENFKNKNVTYYEIVQEKGDAIFVPSHWHHQIENEIDTISINQNFVNGDNIIRVWQGLAKTLAYIQKGIPEQLKSLKAFPSMCQDMLKVMYGMNCEGFSKLITHIGEKRIALYEGGSNISYNNFKMGKNQALYDLKSIYEAIKLMTKHPTYLNYEYKISENFLVLHDSFKYIF